MKKALWGALIAGLATTAVASANPQVTVTCPTPGSPTASFVDAGYRDGDPIESTYRAEMNGVVFRTGTVTFTGPDSDPVNLGVLPENVGTVSVFVTAYGYDYDGSAPVNCPPTPPTPESPVPPAPPVPEAPVTPTPPVVEQTDVCPPALKNVYRRNAGRKWVRVAISRGCVKPRKKIVRKRKINCRSIPPGAGKAWYNGKKLGYRCPLPPRRRPPVNPPVTG